MKIYSLQKTTLLDYPGKIASIVFTAGCNLRCPYCQNMEIVMNRGGGLGEDGVLSHLKKRQNTLEGVVISGGEPTLQGDLADFCKKIKELGLAIKLDTNGTNPTAIKELAEHHLIDYVAMDIKGGRENYAKVIGSIVNRNDSPGSTTSGQAERFSLADVDASVSYLLSDVIDYEFRTTVVSELHSEKDFYDIGEWISGAKAYYLQPFVCSDYVPDQSLSPPTAETLEHYREILLPFIPNTLIRGT